VTGVQTCALPIFIRRLPHNLVDAFRSTLEEAAYADLLIHVLDASDPHCNRYYETTLSVLRELGAENIPMITALNKTDRIQNPDTLEELKKRYPNSIAISAKENIGLDILADYMGDFLLSGITHFCFPSDRTDLSSLLYRSGTVISEDYEDEVIKMSARVEQRIKEMLKDYVE
jgi:GTP-binding protein HflX